MNSKVFKIILAVLAIIAISGMGAIIFILVNEDDPDRELTIDEQVEYSYTTEQISVDLLDGRFVQLQFNLITNNSDAREEVEKRQFQFNNILIKESVDMTSDDLQAGLSELETNLKNEMNELMEEGEITDIYIVGKIVQ
ncbi:flagellar basal body-associated FliL family protein [Amphibacillus jilinensis]|uniref:flagellar basal body-associated FliL family protein n=1 Tax=Amphibacillus jilinensis TaxID=1216008 RepID=UPI00030B7ABF|nr:flagellar basal body-associated FliL family protein [Amphibacillus jilinensis]